MKKLIVAVALLALPFNAFASFDTNLKYSAKGSAVTELQEFLVDKGFLNTAPTGNFYSLTLAAVKKFQTANNLPSTGYFGPMSRTVANSILAADTSASDSEEVTEVGSVAPPVNTSPMDSLNQKIVDLTAQVAAQKALQEQTNNSLRTIVNNTTPAPVQEAVVAPVVDKSEILVSIGKIVRDSINSEQPYGEFPVDVSVLNPDGTYSRNAPVTFLKPSDDANYGNVHIVDNDRINSCQSSAKDSICSVAYGYIPTTPGTKELTFTSGGLTKTVELVVDN